MTGFDDIGMVTREHPLTRIPDSQKQKKNAEFISFKHNEMHERGP